MLIHPQARLQASEGPQCASKLWKDSACVDTLTMCPVFPPQEREERRKRDEIREERKRERERERRLEARDGHGPSKKSKLTRDR